MNPSNLDFRAQVPANVGFEIVVEKAGNELERLNLSEKAAFIVGRNSQLADCVLLHQSISRQHAAFIWKGTGELYVMDLGSAHGTQLNRVEISTHDAVLLHDQDQIRFGESSRLYKVVKTTVMDERAARKAEIDAMTASLRTTKRPAPPSEEEEHDDDEPAAENDIAKRYRLPISHEIELPGHSKLVSCIAIDRAGARVATGSMDYNLQLWDFAGMARHIRPFREIEVEEGNPIVALSYSPSGDKLVVATGSSQPTILDREGVQLLKCIKGDMYVIDMLRTKGHTHAVTGTQWHPTERHLFLTSSLDGTVREWHLEGKQTYDHLENQKVYKAKSKKAKRVGVTACTYSPDATLIWMVTADGQIQAFDKRKRVITPQPERIVREAHAIRSGETGITSITVADNNRYLVTRGGDNCVKLWDCRKLSRSPTPLKTFDNIMTRYETANCAFSPLGTSLAVPCGSRRVSKDQMVPGCVKIFDLSTAALNPIHYVPLMNEESAVCVNWAAPINQLLVGLADGRTKVMYSPDCSEKGAMLTATRKLRPHLDSTVFARIEGAGDIHLPNALPMYQDDMPMNQQKNRDRRDPKKSKLPERPVSGPGVNGKVSSCASFTAYYMQGRLKGRTVREEDPRDAILKYAEKAKANPHFFGQAYKGNEASDERYQLAAKTLEQEKQDKQEEQDRLLR